MNDILERYYDVSYETFIEILASVGKPVFSNTKREYDIIHSVCVSRNEITVTLEVSGFCIPLDLFAKEYLWFVCTETKAEKVK